MKQLLYATNNPGKHEEVRKHLAQHKISIKTPQDYNLDLDPEESGKSLEENAKIKCQAFIEAVNNPNVIVIADDTGVEIDALNGEPGIHVRRWKGYKMRDEEIIEYCIERMRDKSDRGAQFRTVIALGSRSNPIQTFDGILRGEIVKEPIALKMVGFPFESIFYIPEYETMLGDIHQMSIEEKEKQGFHSHRERAVTNALSTIKELLKS